MRSGKVCTTACVAAALLVFGRGLAAAATITVAAGGDLQGALNMARAGDVIELSPGATYTGAFVLPVFTGSTPVVLRTRGTLPDRRLTPADLPLLATIRSNVEGVIPLQTAPGAHHWTIEGVAVTQTGGQTYDLIRLGSGEETTLAAMPHHITLDRTLLYVADTMTQRRGIATNGNDIRIARSSIWNIKEAGNDSQAVSGRQGERIAIVDNFLEAAAENVLFGGAEPGIVGAVVSDVLIEGNDISKPDAWRTSPWQIKNLLELKVGRRVTIRGNRMSNNWSQAQDGTAILFTPRAGNNPATVIEDVLFEHNTVLRVDSGIDILGYDDYAPSQQTARITIRHNVFTGLKDYWLVLLYEPRDIVAEHNTVVSDRWFGGALAVEGPPVQGVVFRNNLVGPSWYGIFGSGMGSGTNAINYYMPGSDVRGNVLGNTDPQYDPSYSYPAGNWFPAPDVFAAQFVPGTTTLTSTSLYRGAATDGTDVGANLAPVAPISRPINPRFVAR